MIRRMWINAPNTAILAMASARPGATSDPDLSGNGEVIMRKRRLFWILAFLLLCEASARAWNLDAKHINALEFFRDGRITFTLFDAGASGPEFRCAGGVQWFFVRACGTGVTAAECLASVQRMGSMLLAAKLSGKQVFVERSACEVTRVALKP
jgi:hypothetical protein